MLDAQIEQHRVSESMDVDDQPGLSDPDAEMVDENYGDKYVLYFLTIELRVLNEGTFT